MKRLLFLFLTSCISILTYAQTAQEVIAKHLEVTGGISQWKSFNSVILKGEMTLGINEIYPIEVYQQRPNLNKTIMVIKDKKVLINGYNGKKAVQYNFSTGKLLPIENYTPETFESDLLDYALKGFQAILEGYEKINNSDCFKIKLIKNTNINTYFFDKNTYQLIREITTEETKTYSDFRKVSGLYFPYRIEVVDNNNQSDFVLRFITITVNKNIPPKEFDF